MSMSGNFNGPGPYVVGIQDPVSGGGVFTNKSILTPGGDHPYKQWWGTNGRDGMFGMYNDLGITPYIAICADEADADELTSGNGATLGKAGMLTIPNARDMEARGAEFVSHGARHINTWDLCNTGIRVYYTGAEAAPTVNISTTQLTTSTATTGATAFLFSAHPTLAELQTAINALSGWKCLLATELLGTESSSALMPLIAARSVSTVYAGAAIASITRVGTTATMTTSTPHNLGAGHQITVTGASPAAYNGTFTFVPTSLTAGTYVMASDPGASAAGGSYTVSDSTFSHQRFAISGGIMIKYTGLDYRDVAISVNDGSNFFSIFADGARLLATATGVTMTTIVTAINALAIPGLTALIMDNGRRAQFVGGSFAPNPGQAFRETYFFGDESGLGLHRVIQAQSINFTGFQAGAGVGFAYTVRRTILAVKERCASIYGVGVKSFAQPGGKLNEWHTRTMADEHLQWRGNRSFTDVYSAIGPHAIPCNHAGQFTGHFTSIKDAPTSGTPYKESDVKAIFDALADAGGWMVNWLNHLCTPTPLDPSPYTGMDQHGPSVYTSSADQDEGPFWRELQHAASLRDAGLIDILPPSKAELARASRKGPTNLIFNAKFRNGRSDNLLGVVTSTQGSGGIAMPGWAVAASAADFTVASVGADRAITFTTNGALGAAKTPLACSLFLEPGKTYDIGAVLDLMNWGAANNVRWALYAIHNNMGDAFPIAINGISSQPFFGGGMQDACMRLTVPPRGGPAPAYVRGIAGPFAFTAGHSLTVNLDNRAASAPIVMTGLTTAKAVADAINAALAVDATYGTLAQYHNAARAEDNRLIIESPIVNGATSDAGSLMTLSNSVGTPLANLFGAGVTTVRANSRASAPMDTSMVGYRLAVSISATSATQTMKVLAPYCREVKI